MTIRDAPGYDFFQVPHVPQPLVGPRPVAKLNPRAIDLARQVVKTHPTLA